MKLSRPQAELLREIADKRQSACEGYKPLMRLLDLGYVIKERGRFSDIYTASDAGRQALAALDAKGV